MSAQAVVSTKAAATLQAAVNEVMPWALSFGFDVFMRLS
jgi:hypothetical protein